MVNLEIQSIAGDEYDRIIKVGCGDKEFCFLMKEHENYIEKSTGFSDEKKGQIITGTVSIEYVTGYKKVAQKLSYFQPIADSPHVVAIVEVTRVIDECIVIAKNSIVAEDIRIEFENSNLPSVGDVIEVEGCLVFQNGNNK